MDSLYHILAEKSTVGMRIQEIGYNYRGRIQREVRLARRGYSLWTVRAHLPLVGIILLIVLVASAITTLAYAIEHLHRRFSRYEHVQISQYGSVLHRRNEIVEIAPYQLTAKSVGHDERQENVIEGEIEEADKMPELLPPIPTFAEMLETGMIQAAISQGQMILGFYADTHQARMGSWLDLYSAGNGGVTGSGKSTTTRFLLFQAVLASAKLIMIDPHIGDPDESLSHQFSLLPASIHQIRPRD
jgi:Helicase HerA, central domain